MSSYLFYLKALIWWTYKTKEYIYASSALKNISVLEWQLYYYAKYLKNDFSILDKINNSKSW